MNKKVLFIPLALLIAFLALAVAPLALAGDVACDTRVNDNVNKLMECVTLGGVRAHQAALQAIADANGGVRTSGTPGYDESVDYVAGKLEDAGYNVTIQPFEFTAFRVLGPSTLEQVAPNAVTYVEGTDYELMDQTDPGDVTAAVTAVDLSIATPSASTSGCEAADFAGFPAGNIALMQRGTCTFRIKAENAAAAGAVGAIIFNQGTPGRLDLFIGTLSAGYTGGIPVVSTSFAQGVAWANTPGLVMHIVANVFREIQTTYNVLAETRAGNPNNVVMVGAHLDSVSEGPGIQDNGSGSAAILEVALQMAKVRPRNMVRFAWWGAEESGLVGSTFYVNNLSQEDRDKIALYLNFDMIGSPNFVRFIYDGDGSAFGLVGPSGSDQIEALFERFYNANGLAHDPTAFDGRSDYLAFINNGIPAGGLFTGAEGVKTAAQAAIYGGTAGVAYDHCYHQACDTYDNISLEVLDQNSDAIAYVTLTYAMNTETINGVKGKGNFQAIPGQKPTE